MKKIYLAAPYSSLDANVRDARAEKIMAKAAELINSGYLVFSPITHSHEMAKKHRLPTTFEYWAEANHSMIDWCDAIFVLMIDGYEISRGVNDEISYALETSKEVIFITE